MIWIRQRINNALTNNNTKRNIFQFLHLEEFYKKSEGGKQSELG